MEITTVETHYHASGYHASHYHASVILVVVETQDFASLRDVRGIPMPEQMQTVEELTDKVNAHLKKMGFAWN